jgi:hypothetical protein
VGIRGGFLNTANTIDPDDHIEGYLFITDDPEADNGNRHFIAWEKVPEALQKHYGRDSISYSDRKYYDIPNRYCFGYRITGMAEVSLLPTEQIKERHTGFFTAGIALGVSLYASSADPKSKTPLIKYKQKKINETV